MANAHWQRLDVPGQDHAELTVSDGGYRIDGRAHFIEEGGLTATTYLVVLTRDWVTRSASVRALTPRGRRKVLITSDASGWTLNGQHEPAVTGCLDVDLAFTPATNLISLRRLALEVGDSAEATVAWLNLSARRLEPLRQIYRRVTLTHYDYVCPDIGFRSTLLVDADGFVREYPPLWKQA
jgi:hypothetical protein